MRAEKIPWPAHTCHRSHRDRGRDAPALFVRRARHCVAHQAAHSRMEFRQRVVLMKWQGPQDLMDRVVDLAAGWRKAALARWQVQLFRRTILLWGRHRGLAMG